MKRLILKKLTLASLNSSEQSMVVGGVVKYTYRPGSDCGIGDQFTYVAACPETFVCGNDSADCSPTGGPGGGGGSNAVTCVNFATCPPKR